MKNRSELTFKISFLGDISLNDNYITKFKQGENPFDEVENILKKSELVVGNLECMVNGSHGENLLKKPRLSTTAETLHYLEDIHLDIACLAHNHVYDHLEDGYQKTCDKLDELGIKYLGVGYSQEEALRPLILSKNGITIALLNYVTRDTNPNLPDDAGIFVNLFETEKVKNQIKSLWEKVDHIVLLLHWGGRVENGFYPDWDQPAIAKELIDAGADLIIGHHSHTVQPFEEFKGKMIFYSLGNFCFSDIRFEDRIIELKKEKNTVSVILNITFEKNQYSFSTVPIENVNGWIKIRKKSIKWKKKNRRFRLISASAVLWQLYFLKHRNLDPITDYFFRSKHGFIKQVKSIDTVRLKKYFRKKFRKKEKAI